MKKSTLLMVLSLVLALALGVGGTMAYLQDTDEDVNVMTLGNVQIDQIEKQRDENGNIVDFVGNDLWEKGKPLYPAVGPIEWAEEYQAWETGGSNQLFTDELKNVQDKFVFVENTGKSTAYVRTWFAFEAGDLTVEEINNGIVHWNRNTGFWSWTDFSDDMTATIDGTKYYLRVATYKGNDTVHIDGILPSGETTRPSLLQVFLDSKATNDDIAAFGEEYDILVFSQAVQTEGFDSAEAALNEAFGEAVAANKPWKEPLKRPGTVYSGEDIQTLFAGGGTAKLADDVILNEMGVSDGENNNVEIDLNGKKITADTSNGITFYALNGGSIDINGNGVVDMTSESEKKSNDFFITEKGLVTVNGGTFLMSSSSSKANLFVQNSGKLVINDGTFKTSDPNSAIAYCINGFIEINGGFFQNTANPNQALLNMGNNLNYINNQKITLSGGTFVNWNPMNSSFAYDWPQCPALIVLADGYEMVSETQDNGDVWYTVVKK